MPMINIEYDNTKVSDSEVTELATAIQKIVSRLTDIKDVFVYANSAHIKVNVAPIEIFIRPSVSIVVKDKELTTRIKKELASWKKENTFSQPINLTLIPMQWEIEVGI